MFKKHESSEFDTQIDIQSETSNETEMIKNEIINESKSTKNILLKGSKLNGDIKLNHDMELHGEVEGNIISEGESNITIKGKCKGSIQTEGGNIDLDGYLSGGDIITGGTIKIMGKFDGGRVEAQGKIFVNGEFHGVLESPDIEIGPNARGKGELYYRDSITVEKGAQVEINIKRSQKNKKDNKKAFKKNVEKTEQDTDTKLNSTDQLIKAIVCRQ